MEEQMEQEKERNEFYNDLKNHYKKNCTILDLISNSIKRAIERHRNYAKVVTLSHKDYVRTFSFLKTKNDDKKYEDNPFYDKKTGVLVTSERGRSIVESLNALKLHWKLKYTGKFDSYYLMITDINEIF